MRQGMRAIGLLGLVALLNPLVSTASSASAAKHIPGAVSPQIEAASFVANTYPHATSISFGVVIVPNPLVPRYRRPYDLSIKAIELGMLKDNYVLDRYAFPWSRGLQQDDALNAAAASSASSSPASASGAQVVSSRGAYGLMVFRCDAWRGDTCGWPGTATSAPHPAAVTRLRALYIVTDTATQGVDQNQLSCAIRSIEAQLADPTETGRISPRAAAPTSAEPTNAAPTSAARAIVAPPSAAAAGANPSLTRCPAPRSSSTNQAFDAGAVPSTAPLAYPNSRCSDRGKSSSLVVLGPNFSGAMDSIGAVAAEFKRIQFCVISSAATDSTNSAIDAAYANVRYASLALVDSQKILQIARFARRAGIDFPDALDRPQGHARSKIAILAEASTFGYGVCDIFPPSFVAGALRDREGMGLVYGFCNSATRLSFPATIADIRYGLQQQQAQQANDLATAASQVQNDQHLSLEDGAENGSEFPESQESALTAASDQLQLDQTLNELTSLAPRMVIVVATDVRDRLFLFDQLRERLPRALLVDLEADNLLTHPDFLHASRGALALSSANLIVHDDELFGCEHRFPEPIASASAGATATSLAPWSTDAQAMLADTTARLYDGAAGSPESCVITAVDKNAPRQAALQVVTLNGFREVSAPFAASESAVHSKAAAPRLWWHHAKPRWFLAAEIYAPICCLLLPWTWLHPKRLRSRKPGSEAAMDGSRNFLSWPLLLCAPMFVASPIVAGTSLPGAGHSLAFGIAALEALGIWGLWHCDRKLQQILRAEPMRLESPGWVAASLAFAAALLAASPLIWSIRPTVAPAIIDQAALIALGFDASSGLAFFLAVAVATLVLLATSAGIATAIRIANRHARLLMTSKPGAAFDDDPFYRPLSSVPALLAAALIMIMAMPGLLDDLGGARLSIFDPSASTAAVFALAATTLCAAILLYAAAGVARRILVVCGFVRRRVLELRKHGAQAEIPGLWTGSAAMPLSFAATPVLARVAAGGAAGARLLQPHSTWSGDLAGLLDRDSAADANRLALFMVLAGEISLFRWAAAGAAASALASIIVVYLYPIEADTLLLLSLVILALTGLLCAVVATAFERDEVLSNVICNRPKKAQVSTAFFLFIAAPVLVLAAAIAVVAIPGVVDWAGGVLAMMRALGVHP